MNHNGDLIRILKRVAVAIGIAIAIISVYFSYDGLDQAVGQMATNTSEAARYIGAFVAIVITLLQFIFNTDFRNLNTTLKVIGGLSYAYSIYTNFRGIQHIFGYDVFIAWFLAGLMDILPESLIAWGLDEHLQGDFLGNLTKLLLGDRGSGHPKHSQASKSYASNAPVDTQPRMHPMQNQPKQGQGRSFMEQKFRGNREQKGNDKADRFSGFGE